MEDAKVSRQGFTLIELLVVISIIAILVGIALPALSMARKRAQSAACMANLRNFGQVMVMYHNDYDDLYPVARYMPPPLLSGDTDPPLTEVLAAYLPLTDRNKTSNKVYKCPGDNVVYPVTGSSYSYQIMLGGEKLEDVWLVKWFKLPAEKIYVLRDQDGGTFDLDDGSQIVAPFFHTERNFLFADGHVSTLGKR